MYIGKNTMKAIKIAKYDNKNMPFDSNYWKEINTAATGHYTKLIRHL